MSPSLRQFMLVSIIGMTLVLASLLYFHIKISGDYLEEHMETHNKSLAVVLRNSLVASGLGVALVRDREQFSAAYIDELDATLAEELRWVPVVKVKIYSRDATTLYSTKRSEVGRDASGNPGVQSALQGVPVSDLVRRDHENKLDGSIEKVDLHQQYIPVKNQDTGTIDGVFEIYADVSKILENASASQRRVFWSIAGILAAFYLAISATFLRTHWLLRDEQRQREAHLAELAEIRSELERRVAERTAELDKSKSFLKSVIDGIGNPLLVIRPDFTVSLMNDAARRLIPEHLQGGDTPYCYQISHRRNHPCKEPDHPCSFAQVMHHGRAARVRHTHYDDNNQPVLIDLVSTPLYNDSGDFEGVIEVEHDVTQLVRMQAGLVESEARLQAIMDNVPDAILTCDADCVIQSLNPSAMKLLKGSEADLIGERLTRFIAGADGNNPLKTNSAESSELQMQRLDGTEFPADVWVGPLAVGDETSYIAVVRDISTRIKAQQELDTTRQQYFQQEKMAALGQLAAGILHEVGNPIAAIAGAAAELKGANACGYAPSDECPMEDALTKNIDLIDEQTLRLGRITREIADFASPRPRERELLDLNSLLQSTARLLGYDRRFRDIDLKLNLDSALPAIVGVADQLTQVFMNLLINAVDACLSADERKNCVLVRSTLEGGRVRVSFEDSGGGMSHETLEHAMEPFFTTKPVGKGNGLGLSLCDTIARSHGGWIELESELGEGTKVHVLLPVDDRWAQSVGGGAET